MSPSARPIDALCEACFSASQAAKAMIDREMLEAVWGRAGYGRVRVAKAETSRSRGARYRRSVDLRCFAPHDGRPLSVGGSTSFHFAFETIVKATGDGGIRAAVFDRYVSDPEKVELVSSDLHERYLVQAKAFAPDGASTERAAFVVSSIGVTLEEREDFWLKRETGARSAGAEALVFRAANGDRGKWMALAADDDTPAGVANIARRLGLPDKFEAQASLIVFEITDDAARDWAKTLGRRFGDKAATRMVHYRRPRAGRVQTRFVMELPHEFTPADRCAVVRAFTKALTPSEAGRCLPFTAVIHEPDLRNDERNFHCHLIMAPALYGLLDDGSVDHGDKRELRPGALARMVAPERAGEIDRLIPGERIREDGRALRRFFADLCNERLMELKVERRLDPRSYAEMGIDQEPQEHLSSQAAALVAAGCSVEIDHRNAVRSWTGVDRRRLAALAEEKAIATAQLGRIDEVLAGDIPPDSRARLTQMKTDLSALADDVARGATALGEYDLHVEMARSAAKRLFIKSDRTLHSVRLALARTHVAREQRRLIQARYNLAMNHLNEVDARLEPWEGAVEMLRVQLFDDRQALGKMSLEIDAALNDVRRDAQADWWKGTILGAPRGTLPLQPHDHASRLILHLQQQAPSGYPPHRFVLVDRDHAGVPVPINLKPRDLALLDRPHVAPRLQAQLEKTATFQALEVDRLLAAIQAHGLSNVIEGRKDDAYLPGAPDDLFRRYRDHPRYQTGRAAAQAAYDRIQRVSRQPIPSPQTAAAPIVASQPILSLDPVGPGPANAATNVGKPHEPEHRHVHEPSIVAVRAAQRQRQFLPQPGVEPPGDLAATPALAGMPRLPQVDVVPDRAGADVPLPRDAAADLAHPDRNNGADVRRAGTVAARPVDKPVVSTAAPSPKPRIRSLPTTAQLAERKEAASHPDRLRERYRDVVRKAVKELHDVSFVPVRERGGRLTIVVKLAIGEDADELRRIKVFEQEAMIQTALADARERMLARLRDPNGRLGDLDGRRFKAATRAAHKDPEVVRLMLTRSSSAAGTGTDIAKLRAGIRAAPDRRRRNEQTPQGLDDDALFQAMLAKRSGNIER